MPFVIYIFALSAFALGLAEFIPIGLSGLVAGSLHVGIEQAGMAVTAYALGATFAAPVLSALTAGWSRKRAMLATTLVFSLGSLVAGLSSHLSVLLPARLAAGLGHGLFLAVATSTAATLAGPRRAGQAVAIVFGGFTLALAIGVPLGTYLGNLVSWRPIFLAIGGFGMLGLLGLGMRDPLPSHGTAGSALHGLRAIFHGKLLGGALVTVLAYAGPFTVYTYIAPLLTQVTAIGLHALSIFMLIYGVMAAVGNLAGGKLADRLGADKASFVIILAIALVVLGMWIWARSAWGMGILVALLGALSYAAVPALQSRLLGIAGKHAPHAQGVAAGLNIAGFNSGIALGSLLGSATISVVGITYIGMIAAIVAGLGLVLLAVQIARGGGVHYQAVAGAGH